MCRSAASGEYAGWHEWWASTAEMNPTEDYAARVYPAIEEHAQALVEALERGARARAVEYTAANRRARLDGGGPGRFTKLPGAVPVTGDPMVQARLRDLASPISDLGRFLARHRPVGSS